MTTSAKSLFRAISGVKAAPLVASLMVDLPVQERPKPDALRRADDYYPTVERDAIYGLLSVDGPRIRSLGAAWEPSCGAGDLVLPIREAGIPCLASDLRDRGCPDSWQADYFTCLKSRAPSIITNPPYDQINARDGHGRWLRHSLDMPGWCYMALLLSWDWPAAHKNGLGALLDRHPFSYAYLCRWKIDFTGEGSPPQRNAWFVWDKDDPRSNDRASGLPEPGFRWLDRVDYRQEVMTL